MNYKERSDSFFETAERLKRKADDYMKLRKERLVRKYLELVSYNLGMANYNLQMAVYEKLEQIERDLEDLRSRIELKDEF